MSITIEGVIFNGGDAWDRVTFRGVTLEKRTAAFILDVEADLGHKLTLIQGSYNPGVGASGGTHDKGGVFDCWDVFGSEPLHIQRILRKHGGFGWFRPTLPGVWNQHIHCGVLGEIDMAPTLAAQVPDYRNYLDGLASHAPDPTWHPFARGNNPSPVFDYPKWLEENFVPFPFSDEIPVTDKKTIGEALREALRGDEHFAAIQANVNDLQAKANARFDNTNARLDTLETIVKNLADVTDEILAAVKP
jgi:hypothetical protein